MRRAATFLLMAASASGCTLLATLDEHQGASGALEAGTDGTAPIDGSTDAIASNDCSTLFVRADADPGDTTRDGCSTAHPLKSIGEALSAAAARDGGVPVRELRVCKGTYPESIVLDRPISIRGGYACDAAFTRNIAGHLNDAKIFGDSVVASGDAVTLRITGSQIDRAVEIEGLTIFGGPVTGGSVARGTRAISVEAGASPRILQNVIAGGSGSPAAGVGSVGIQVVNPASPEISDNQIDGGSGKATEGLQVGSVGIRVDFKGADCAASIHHNTVSGGSGSTNQNASVGSVGVQLVETTGSPTVEPRLTVPLASNRIDGGSGTQTASGPDGDAAAGSIGVWLAGAAGVVRGNFIDGGTGAVTRAPLAVVAEEPASIEAVRVSRTGALVTIDSNRIFAGSPRDSDSRPDIRGIQATYPRLLDIVNNFLLGPGRNASTSIANASLFRTTAGNNGELIAIRQNTFVPQPAASYGNFTAIDTAGGNSTYVIQNNLFFPAKSYLGAGHTSAVLLRTCTAPLTPATFYPEFASVRGNYFVQLPALIAEYSATGPQPLCAARADTFSNVFGQGGAAAGNRRGSDSCAAEPAATCDAESCTQATCATAFLAGFSGDGLAALSPTDGGLPLKPNISCAIAKGSPLLGGGVVPKTDGGPIVYPFDGGPFLIGAVPRDGFDIPRDSPVSTGAHEQNICP